VTTYQVKILSAGTTTVTSLIYDHSGSSYHYNNDFGTGVNSLTITSIDSEDLSLAMSHTGNFATGQQGTYDMTVTNTGSQTGNGPDACRRHGQRPHDRRSSRRPVDREDPHRQLPRRRTGHVPPRRDQQRSVVRAGAGHRDRHAAVG